MLCKHHNEAGRQQFLAIRSDRSKGKIEQELRRDWPAPAFTHGGSTTSDVELGTDLCASEAAAL